MKISLEFSSVRDLLVNYPKFAELIGGEGSPDERFAQALADDPSPLILKITPADGAAFTPEQKAAIRKTIEEYVDKAKDNTIARIAKEQAPAAKEEKPAETVESAPVTTAEAAPKEKPSKSPAKEKKAEKEPDSSPEEHVYTKVEATHVLGYLIQNDHRDDVKKILSDAGAENLRTMDPSHYGEAIKAARAFIPDDVFEKLLDPKKYKEVLKTK